MFLVWKTSLETKFENKYCLLHLVANVALAMQVGFNLDLDLDLVEQEMPCSGQIAAWLMAATIK